MKKKENGGVRKYNNEKPLLFIYLYIFHFFFMNEIRNLHIPRNGSWIIRSKKKETERKMEKRTNGSHNIGNLIFIFMYFRGTNIVWYIVCHRHSLWLLFFICFLSLKNFQCKSIINIFSDMEKKINRALTWRDQRFVMSPSTLQNFSSINLRIWVIENFH